MERTVRDNLARHFENLEMRNLNDFRNKLVDECKAGKTPEAITKRRVELAQEESKLAELLVEAFGEDALNKTVAILKFIGCNDTATKLRAEYPESIVDQQLSSFTEVYNMNKKPRGTCVIFNNVEFCDGKGKRSGSDKDAEVLKSTFERLRFDVVVLRDSKVQVMKDKLEELRKKMTDDDCCFVCCVLSHGNEEGVIGYDKAVLPIRDILYPFSGSRCPALAGKPKVFFIQACRGSEMQQNVEVQADSLDEKDSDLSVDSIIRIPDFADFLISMSTFEGYYALRNPVAGSWFIQSLCDQLTKLCPKGEDILSILTKVNSVVGAMGMSYKQIPEPRFTLRKKLVFHVPE